MGFYWKIELSKNEIALLQGCDAYTESIKKLPRSEKKRLFRERKGTPSSEYPALWSDHVHSRMSQMHAPIRYGKSLREDGLIGGENDIWLITKKGRMVLELIQGDVSKLANTEGGE